MGLGGPFFGNYRAHKCLVRRRFWQFESNPALSGATALRSKKLYFGPDLGKLVLNFALDQRHLILPLAHTLPLSLLGFSNGAFNGK